MNTAHIAHVGHHADASGVLADKEHALNVAIIVATRRLPAGYSGVNSSGQEVLMNMEENSVLSVAVGGQQGKFTLTDGNDVCSNKELNDFLRRTCRKSPVRQPQAEAAA